MPSTPLGRLMLALATLAAVAVVVPAIGAVLLFTGGPGPCTLGGGPLTVSAAHAQAFDDKWHAFEDRLDAGTPASVVFTESEVTSRAAERLVGEAREVHDLRVCLHDGYAEATATLDLPGFFSLRGRVKGGIDLTAPHPTARVDDIDMGNVPGIFTEPSEDFARKALDKALDEVDLEHSTYSATFSEGALRIDGAP
jgi:hypothetical protein